MCVDGDASFRRIVACWKLVQMKEEDRRVQSLVESLTRTCGWRVVPEYAERDPRTSIGRGGPRRRDKRVSPTANITNEQSMSISKKHFPSLLGFELGFSTTYNSYHTIILAVLVLL